MTSDRDDHPPAHPKTEPLFDLSPEPPSGADVQRNEAGEGGASLWIEGLEKARAEERKALEGILEAQLKEQRKVRRGKAFFRGFIMLYLLALLFAGMKDTFTAGDLESLSDGDKHTAVVKLEGPIMAGTKASAETVIKGLRKAFKDPDSQAVILRINTPGGSAVQSGRLHDEIVRLRKKHPDVPLYAALDDICASGGYYAAAAAKEIYADKSTLVGSIGAILQGFGAEEAIKKLGIESRTFTAGEHKAFLDPFKPMKASEKGHVEELLKEIHRQFIQAVISGRGARLKGDRKKLFSGLIWTGEKAVGLGLIDGLGSTDWIAREVVKAPKVVDFTVEDDWVARLSEKMGVTLKSLIVMEGAPTLR